MQNWTSANLSSLLVINKADEKLLPVILDALYVVLRAKTLVGSCGKRWMSNVLQLKSQQQLFISHT